MKETFVFLCKHGNKKLYLKLVIPPYVTERKEEEERKSVYWDIHITQSIKKTRSTFKIKKKRLLAHTHNTPHTKK